MPTGFSNEAVTRDREKTVFLLEWWARMAAQRGFKTMEGEELKIASVEKPFEESSGELKQREIWNL